MHHRYIVIINPFFGMVPIFYNRVKAVVYCAGTRQHVMNIYPKDLGYSKKGNISTSPKHSIVDKKGNIIYEAEICRQDFDLTIQAWVNTPLDS